MPYKIVKRGNEYVVINKRTRKVKGRHRTREKALRHMRALYAAKARTKRSKRKTKRRRRR